MSEEAAITPVKIAPLVHVLRHEKVILDFDMAALYGVEKQAVRRNRDGFPADFMFELSEYVVSGMVSQIVIPSRGYFGGALPYA